ncbi:MAG: NUDIX hydrolase [Leptospira bouyouniensis]|uniref:NUDIX hydrolase n=1 Tax=Leptospira bouyouniensis TaxID=2484911 RepID=A0A7I0HS79_9LEPT|nr:NUDIX hydrolase [Leptospira bouyouniensis]TGK52553.1 NUDIX hydrolase [Leptospira bouyouniensis]TGL06446.1 NUDIX hydrolase [Leptospira bouyouniensis]TGM85306.1 NUDIX hydrolase [Leptospira bouyouniensis]
MIDFLLKSKSMRVRVAALIQDPKGKILLVQQQKKQSGYWLLPGGGIEFGESGEEALKRELKEELSLEVSHSEFLLLNESIDPNQKRHLIQIVFLTKVKELLPVINAQEKAISGFGYFTPKEILEMDLRPDIKHYFRAKSTNKPRYISSPWVNEP